MEKVIMDIGALGNVATNMQRTANYQSLSAAPLNADPALAPAVSVQTTDASKKAVSVPSMDQLKQAVQDINKSLQSLSQGLEFSIDADSKQTVVKVIDPQTKEIIRQMPSEQALEIAKALDQVIGKLIREKA